ncbi:MAG: beta-mannosidase, partial [Muribaculaceae bacterium]|nr:beta-mannosidase [Muribaculaceae bacterium]
MAVSLTAAARQINLNSADGIVWEICPQDNLKNVPGTAISVPGFVMGNEAVEGIVPGTTFAAYVASGKEANPEWGDNIYLVDETYYNRPLWYRAEFEAPVPAEGEHLWINFDNTHRYADFYFNGVKISGTASSTRDVKGHMVRSSFDVTNLLKSDGPNVVAVLITDPDTKKTRDAWEPYGITCSPSYMSAAGWDWMPYVPGRLSGITGRVYLTITGGAVIADPWVRGLTPDNSRGEVKVQATLRNVTGSNSDVTLRGTINPGNITFEKTVSVNAKNEYTVSVDAADCPALNIAD